MNISSTTNPLKRAALVLLLALLAIGNALAQGYDLNQCTVSNVPEESYLYTSSVISLPTPVVTYGNVTLVEGTHYTATITKSNGDVVTEVRYTGDYTLTLAAISPCTGTRQFPFSVVMPWYGLGDNWFAPYRIHSVEEFEALAYWVSRGHTFEGRYFRLDADLAYDPETPNNHMPIGNEQHPFKGAFEGRNFTISGIRISGDGDYQGLFGYIIGDTVKNLNLTDAEIAGGTRVAGLVAYNYGGNVKNCHVSNATISGSGDYVGGIVGWSKNDTLMDCTVSNATFAAGSGAIIGSNNFSCYRHHNYYFDCTVGGATVNVGTGSGDTGGARLALPINLPATLVLDGSSADGIIRDDQLYGGASEHLVLDAPDELIYQYPCDNGTVAPLGPSTYKLIIAADATTAVNVNNAIDIWDVANGADGSEAHPYLITTTEDMDYLAVCVNFGGHLADTWLTLGNDIAYDPDNLTIDHDGDGINESNYTAIGYTFNTYNDHPFSGHFDGGGHTISGIRLHNSYRQGVFGYVEYDSNSLPLVKPDVKNLILDNSEISGIDFVGGIVGSGACNVTNCHVTNTVILSGHSFLGGIVGTGGSISHCTSAAQIFGTGDRPHNIGGITNNGDSISYCISTVTFTFSDYTFLGNIGGISGIGGNISHCLVVGVNISSDSTVTKRFLAAIMGNYDDNYYTLDHNYYYNCSVDGETTNIGICYKINPAHGTLQDLSENDGAVPGYLLTLGNHITSDALTLTIPACGETPETTYHVAPSGTTVNLSFEYPDSAITYYVNGEAIEGNTFTMPAEDVTVKAVWTDYTIHSAADWELFCDALQDNDTYNRFIGETVLLAEDITVTRMAGSSTHDFMGTFDGQGHTLTVAFGTAEEPFSEEYAAPFRYVENGANIHNLHVDGHIYTSNKYAGGIVGCQYGTVSVSNCRSSVIVHSSKEGDGTHGGIVAVHHGTLTVNGCVFDGRLLTTNGTTLCGGLIGYHYGTLTLSDCLYAPASDVTLAEDETYINDGATFCRNYSGTPTNCYYTETLGTAQGKQAHSITPGEGVLMEMAGEATEYDVSGLTTCGTGLQYGNILYAGNGEEVSLTFTLTDPEGFSVTTAIYTPEGGTATELASVNGVYSFTMPDADVVIDAVTEYLIHNATEWGNFCDALQDNDIYNRFIGKTVKLCADITVTRMAGSDYHDFMGIFDGQGHTLTIAYGSAENPISEEYAAPFRNLENGAVIHNLHVEGLIYTSNQFASGIAGCQWGTVSISNCRSSVIIHSSINGDGTHGGIVAVHHGTLTVSGCVFDGRLLTTNGTTLCGGLIGWRYGTCTLSDCLYAPATNVTLAQGETYINNGATFCRNYNGTLDNCYYTETLGTAQGKLAIANPAVSPAGEATATYNVSGLAFYSNGVQFDEVFYHDPEAVMTQTIALSAGVNWISTYLDITLGDLKAALVAAMPNNNAAITIKSKTQNVKYQNGRWAGSLTTFDVTQLYLIIVPEACEISFEGVPINPSAHTVTITPGANWIAFPYNESMTVMDFFGSFPVNNDVVKSKFQNTRYNNGRWGGQLNTLIPGQGYIYNSAATGDRTFTFPTSAK